MKQSYITSNATLTKNQAQKRCDVFDNSSTTSPPNWRKRTVSLLAISLTLFLAATNVNAQSCDYVAPIQVHYLPIAEDQMHDFFTTAYPGYANC